VYAPSPKEADGRERPAPGGASDVRAMLVSEVGRFARSRLDAAKIERGGRIPEDVIRGLAELGLFGLALPEEHGGAGLGLGDACAVIEELARWDRSVATLVGLHTGLGTRGIAIHGKPEIAGRWLPRLAAGDCVGAFAATEASAGSDLMSMRTTARFVGDEIVLDGEKSYVTNGGFAGCYTVLARSGARAHALVLVPRGTPGVTVGAEEHKLGIRASSTVTLSFSSARVPAAHLLGPADRGLDAAYGVLAWGRTLMASGCVGTMRAALDACLAHVTTRVQFRRALAEFAAVKARVADVAAMLFASRALVGRAAAAVDGGEAAESVTMAAKVFASERTFEACDAAIQLHGALGVLEDVGVARLLRDCRVTRIFEGANDVLLLRIAAARLTGRGRAVRIAGLAPGDLADHCDAFADDLDASTDALRALHGAAVMGKQSALIHLARAEVAHVAAVAAALAAGSNDADLAELAVRRLLRDASAELDGVADTTETERLSARVAERLYDSVRQTATA
jgi:alkylation response protein AidB-like acyl-CoA dehydrogenase